MANDPVLESDLHAYVDDQLDVARRIEVEAYLSQRPQAAAQVMADLRIRDELRLALAERRSPAEPKTREAAGRLQRSLAWRRVYGTLQRVAAVLVFIAAGWAGHAYFGPFGVKEVVASVQPPAFVDEAIHAHKTSLLRKVKAITEELCGHAFSASSISAINKRLDESLKAFAERSLQEPFAYLILDARYEKVREAGVVMSQAVLIAVGIDWDGRRQILSVEMAGRPGHGKTTLGLQLLLDAARDGRKACSSPWSSQNNRRGNTSGLWKKSLRK